MLFQIQNQEGVRNFFSFNFIALSLFSLTQVLKGIENDRSRISKVLICFMLHYNTQEFLNNNITTNHNYWKLLTILWQNP